MLFGLLGNTLTLLVVWLRPHMRSSTYLYLSSMAVSDLLILLLLPLDLYKLWRPRPWSLGDLVCKLTMFLSECCTFCTILHITFLSLERYLAVCWPITAKTLVTRRRTRALIGCLWLGAAVSAAPVLVMVGVEEVGGGEELGLRGWREDAGWSGREGEQGAFTIGGGERGSGHMTSMQGGLEEMKWEEKEIKGWGESVAEFERKLEIGETGDRGKVKEEKEADEEGGEKEGKMEDDGIQQNKMREDEGGGREEGVDKGREVDNRECRCTHFAVSSGLLSAMMILSNLYFLVPLCILGLVYALIGRTLWLRPQRSRKDKSHRHTVKMLGVIVLAFVLCWLPFHVGRTIFSLSLGTGAESRGTNTDTNTHSDMNTPPESTGNMASVTEPVSLSDWDLKTQAYTDRDDALCENTNNEIDTHSDADAHLVETQPETLTDPGTGSDDTSAHHVVSHNVRAGESTHSEMHNTTHNKQNTTICKKSQKDILSLTTPTADTHTYVATPTDITHNNTHTDTHSLFIYYLSQYFNLVSSVLFYLSAAINPLLYNLMSARYRHAVRSLVHTHCLTPSHRLSTTLSSGYSTTTL
ncbi:uncharacterized protein LOC128459010 [Pleuronectes platessa]|uniref:uncharacterized protein LOC128459010 n=1 Tax=Pleuronectes platessa TaxID=8262 RepID=UPI00232A3F6E|nr:uncharacterized protein LOC128459010 [Pleuronectes platessa]